MCLGTLNHTKINIFFIIFFILPWTLEMNDFLSIHIVNKAFLRNFEIQYFSLKEENYLKKIFFFNWFQYFVGNLHQVSEQTMFRWSNLCSLRPHQNIILTVISFHIFEGLSYDKKSNFVLLIHSYKSQNNSVVTVQ